MLSSTLFIIIDFTFYYALEFFLCHFKLFVLFPVIFFPLLSVIWLWSYILFFCSDNADSFLWELRMGLSLQNEPKEFSGSFFPNLQKIQGIVILL